MKLAAYLEAKGLSQREFAEAIGVSQPAICRYCAGRVPKIAVMSAISWQTAGKVTPNDFFHDVEA